MKKNKIKEKVINFFLPNKWYALFLIVLGFILYQTIKYDSFLGILFKIPDYLLAISTIHICGGGSCVSAGSLFEIPIYIGSFLLEIYIIGCLFHYIFRKIRESKFKLFLLIIFFLFVLCNFTFAISDSNLSNNELNKPINIIDTRDLNLIFLPLDDPDSSLYDNQINNSARFIEATFPIADSGSRIYYRSAYDTKTNERNSIVAIDELINKIFKQNIVSTSDDRSNRVIAISPSGWFANTGISEYSDAAGLGKIRSSVDSVIVELTNYRHITAHELGHTFDLCEEYDSDKWQEADDLWFFECPNGDEDDNDQLDSSCISLGCSAETIGTVVPWQNTNNTISLHNIMGNNEVDDYAWISKGSYEHILESLKKTNYEFKLFKKGGVVSGFIEKDGTSSLSDIYVMENVSIAIPVNSNNGTYSIILEDNSNNILSNFTFEPNFQTYAFNGSVVETNRSHFVFIMNLSDDVTEVKLNVNSTLLKSKNKTPNTPSLNITYPSGGEIIENPFNITWNGTDADGDSVYYAILISEDNGSNYTTLDLDLNQSYYELDPNDYDSGNNYVIKLLGTDGINTGTNISSSFSLGNPLNITTLGTLYNSGTHYIFEFIIKNIDSQTHSNISWVFEPGDGNKINSTYQFSLNTNEEILVYIEYNYSAEDTYTVTANATTPLISKVSTTTIGLNDLEVTSFTELYSMGREKVWEFVVKNNGSDNLSNIDWQITGTDANIDSIYSFNLTTNETIRVYVHENLSNFADYTITANAYTDTQSTTSSLETRGKELEVSSFKTLYTNGLIKVYEFFVTNTFTSTINNINWTLFTGETTINSTIPFNLSSSEDIRIIVEEQYASSGNYTVNASVKSSSYGDYENNTIRW
jgi:hypothetical protein